MTDKLLTSKDIISTVRDLSANLATDRIDNYIAESQTVEIRDFLTPTLYAALQNDYDDLLLIFSEVRFTELWYGVEYDGVIFNGLQMALNYWAYARFINQQQTEVTRWGVQSLTAEESEDLSVSQVRIKGRDAEQMALRYQNDAAKFLKARAAIYPEHEPNCNTKGKKTSFNFFKV